MMAALKLATAVMAMNKRCYASQYVLLDTRRSGWFQAQPFPRFGKAKLLTAKVSSMRTTPSPETVYWMFT